MRLSFLICLICGLGLAACTGGQRVDADMADACQLKACACVDDSSSIFDPETTEILWHPDGRAYCPEGFHLEFVSEDD